jgi:uncharacterized protein with PQ loop repeat
MDINTKVTFMHFYEKFMVVMALAGQLIFVLQTHKIWVNQSARDVSLEGFFIAALSIACWLLYGILKNDKVLIQSNIIGLITSSICLVAIIYMKYYA